MFQETYEWYLSLVYPDIKYSRLNREEVIDVQSEPVLDIVDNSTYSSDERHYSPNYLVQGIGFLLEIQRKLPEVRLPLPLQWPYILAGE